MTVTICWRPTDKTSQHFQSGVSYDFEVLKKVFGTRIDPADIPKLRAMRVAANSEFYDEVADIVERVGSISFWGEW